MNDEILKKLKIKFRGAIYHNKLISKILANDYSFLLKEKMGFNLSVFFEHFGFYAVDRFASFPLFYIIVKGKPIVSGSVDELIPHLQNVKFDAVGYYGIGGLFKGERTDRTPFEGIKRIPPGHYLEYRNGTVKLHCYWAFVHLKGQQFEGTYNEAVEELEYLFCQSVKRTHDFAPNMAVHLSGGLDSGSITSIICQLSNEERLAYCLNSTNAPLDNDRYESGFISKYRREYPHLNVKHFDYTKHFTDNPEIFMEAGNWHSLSKNNVECAVLTDANTRGKKYIITGLGGDELATYGHGFQNVSYSIHNDRHAKFYLNWIIAGKRKWKHQAGILLGRIGNETNKLDAILFSQMNSSLNDFKQWYTKKFRTEAATLFNLPVISLYGYPSSYNYRLETLDRSYFTVRSDKWNYWGAKNGVDYLHPLLDADLVDFCASLPRNFFQNRSHRELIKTALHKQLPPSLLMGTKRTLFSKRTDISRQSIRNNISIVQEKLYPMLDSFAGTVYDYKKMYKQLEKYKGYLNFFAETNEQTYLSIETQINYFKGFSTHGIYLNHFFT